MHTSPRPVLAQVRYTKGYTLIELIVVVAIVGILTVVVMGSIAAPRTKGADAAIKADFRTIQNEAQFFVDLNDSRYNTDGSTGHTVGTACPSAGNTMFAANAKVRAAIVHANTVSGGTATCYMNAAGTIYVIWSPMKTPGTYWCIDSTGLGKQKATAHVAETSCL